MTYLSSKHRGTRGKRNGIHSSQGIERGRWRKNAAELERTVAGYSIQSIRQTGILIQVNQQLKEIEHTRVIGVPETDYKDDSHEVRLLFLKQEVNHWLILFFVLSFPTLVSHQNNG